MARVVGSSLPSQQPRGQDAAFGSCKPRVLQQNPQNQLRQRHQIPPHRLLPTRPNEGTAAGGDNRAQGDNEPRGDNELLRPFDFLITFIQRRGINNRGAGDARDSALPSRRGHRGLQRLRHPSSRRMKLRGSGDGSFLSPLT